MLLGLLFLVNLTIKSIATHESCYHGTYKVEQPPFGSCSGYRDCEVGYYCNNGIKKVCPPGTFGSSIRLANATCSGMCREGYYCPAGSTQPASIYCGNATVYCPEGSGTPLVAANGFYTVDEFDNDFVDSQTRRTNTRICDFGYYCVAGEKHVCASGTYGLVQGLSSPGCSGVCPEGWYCPPHTSGPFDNPCSSSPRYYCPAGSDHPHVTESGYFAVSSHVGEGGGFGASVICPRGSFCSGGVRFDCPAGRFGSALQMTNSSCSGVCTAGYYCPAGSISAKQVQCADDSHFCPPGSALPTPVNPGYHSVGTHDDFAQSPKEVLGMDDNILQGHSHVDQAICEPGNYCLRGVMKPCAPGRYGARSGISDRDCDGYCQLGHYCPEGSTSDKQMKCGGADVFCPPGSAEPQTVHSGYYSVLGDSDETRGAERRCEPGFFCDAGVAYMCGYGYWGGEYGLMDYTCSGLCAPGYYCPLGSMSPTEVMCGDADRFCPGGSEAPEQVLPGYYSIGGNDSTRTAQRIAPIGHYALNGLLYVCPAGYFGATEGLTSPSCSGLCEVPGYYCPTGSTSPVMRFCGGDDRYCPANIVAPLRVHSGFYTADYLYEACAPGKYLALDTSHAESAADVLGSAIPTEFTVFSCQLCPEGTYKYQAGNNETLCQPCAAPHTASSPDRIVCTCTRVVDAAHVPIFNPLTGDCDIHPLRDQVMGDAHMWTTDTSLTRYQQHPCEPGHYCQKGLRYKCPRGRYGVREQETDSLCTGVCAAGYFCLQASTSQFSQACGGAEWICAGGSAAPVLVPPGYYSNEDAPESLRSSQDICPKGYYCPGDGRRHPCAAGTYTDELGTIVSVCKGDCEKGHYCHIASPSKTQFECGNATVYCPHGSPHPLLVHDGFYSAFAGVDAGEQRFWSANNSTASVELVCEPGYYCSGGIKQPCPPGTFGWRYGMVSSECGGKCAAGYYCPSYLLPQPGAPKHTKWPLAPHTRAASPDFECGGVTFYCPLGTFFPLVVGGGNYSIGGGKNNHTRHSQAVCSPGSYCKNSVSILCPIGRYGSTPGLADPTCTAGCPPGFYCPSGTVSPIRCPPLQYSTGLVSVCSSCPGQRLTPLPCQNEKGCCFRT